LRGLLLGRGLTAESRVGCLHTQDPSEGDAQLVGLDDRAAEARDLGRVAPRGRLLEGVLARLADPNLVECQAEFLGQRAVPLVGQLRNRSVEAEPGLDADGEQVERVRQLSADQLAALSGTRA